LTDGIKPEYWDFIFESFDPYCDIKLTDLIDLYFSIAENEAKKSRDFIRSIIRLSELKNLKERIRRPISRNKGWLMHIIIGRSSPSSITSKGTKETIKVQYYKVIRMLKSLGAIDDLIEIFNEKNGGQLDINDISYYCKRLFLNSYKLQLKRCNGYGSLYGAEDVLNALLMENEDPHTRNIDYSWRTDIFFQ